ncbi:hypothetical protein FH972_007631 [Carpinus fangiana]|uniref:Uncharacterized protein n=1 Tax=Carpinus fangiana TaxID=176857 RepID=A0A5N6QW24_9ROSI|nr:hypothetical protein FH972_007631 [Carpinus fangiana]
MDGHLVAASVPPLRTWQTPRSFSIDVSSIENDEISDRCLKFLSPRCYNVVFCVPTFSKDLDGRTYTKWYSINIRENGPCEVHTKDKTLSSFWDGKLQATEGFAALGSHVYAFGEPAIPDSGSDLCKLDLTARGPYSLKPVPSMISPKFYPHAFAIDGKIYVFSSVLEGTSPTVHWGEAFDPDNGKWEALPDPPYDTSFIILSAALENPSRILVAFHVPGQKSSTWNCEEKIKAESEFYASYGYLPPPPSPVGGHLSLDAWVILGILSLVLA